MNHLKFGLSTLFLALALGSAGCAPRAVIVQPENSHSITVSGQGEVFAAPDMGRVRLGVEERATTAQAAMEGANRRMAAISEAIKAQGVDPKDLQTTDLSMYFEVSQPQPIAAPQQMKMGMAEAAVEPAAMPAHKTEGAYVVRNTLIVAVRKIDSMGTIIGAAMTAGANHLYGFELTIEDPTILRDQARKQAVDHAVAKAELLAKEAKVKLGPVLSVSELDGGHAVPMMAERSMKMNISAVPVEQGELSLTQNVQVVFSIQD